MNTTNAFKNRSPWPWNILIPIGLLLYALVFLADILIPFFMGFVGAYIFHRPVEKLMYFKISRAWASAVVVLGLILGLTIFMIVFMPFVQRQLFMLASAIPAVLEQWFNTLLPYLERATSEFGGPSSLDLKNQLTSHLGDMMTWSIRLLLNLVSNGLALANLLTLVILTPMIMYYLLSDWPKLIAGIQRMIPQPYQPQVVQYAYRIHRILSRYASGQLMVCFVLVILYTFCLWLIGLPQGLFVGMITGCLSAIPYIGMIIGLLTSIAIAVAHGEPVSMYALILFVFSVIGFIEGKVLLPRLVGEKIDLHPVWILFALLFGAKLLGFLGIIIALPCAAIAGVIVRVAMDWYRTTDFYKGVSHRAKELL